MKSIFWSCKRENGCGMKPSEMKWARPWSMADCCGNYEKRKWMAGKKSISLGIIIHRERRRRRRRLRRRLTWWWSTHCFYKRRQQWQEISTGQSALIDDGHFAWHDNFFFLASNPTPNPRQIKRYQNADNILNHNPTHKHTRSEILPSTAVSTWNTIHPATTATVTTTDFRRRIPDIIITYTCNWQRWEVIRKKIQWQIQITGRNNRKCEISLNQISSTDDWYYCPGVSFQFHGIIFHLLIQLSWIEFLLMVNYSDARRALKYFVEEFLRDWFLFCVLNSKDTEVNWTCAAHQLDSTFGDLNPSDSERNGRSFRMIWPRNWYWETGSP